MGARRSRAKVPSDSAGENIAVNYFKFPLDCRRDGESVDSSARGVGKDLIAIGAMIDSIERTFGSAVIATSVTDLCILVSVRVDRGDALFGGPTLWECAQRTSRELDANVATGAPKPHGMALYNDTLVPLFKQISKSCRTSEVPAPLLIDDAGEHTMPVLDPQSFDQPESSKPKELSGSFRVTGGCLSKGGSISLKLDHDSLWVELESAVERLASTWTLTTLRDGVWIDGKVIRLANGIWQLQEGAKVVTHPALLVDD